MPDVIYDLHLLFFLPLRGGEEEIKHILRAETRV